jgi:hypothetical protein
VSNDPERELNEVCYILYITMHRSGIAQLKDNITPMTHPGKGTSSNTCCTFRCGSGNADRRPRSTRNAGAKREGRSLTLHDLGLRDASAGIGYLSCFSCLCAFLERSPATAASPVFLPPRTFLRMQEGSGSGGTTDGGSRANSFNEYAQDHGRTHNTTSPGGRSAFAPRDQRRESRGQRHSSRPSRGGERGESREQRGDERDHCSRRHPIRHQGERYGTTTY